MKTPGTKCLKLTYDELLSNFAFKFNLRRYSMGRFSKITKFVEYPMELDLSPYMSADAPYEGEGPPQYRLYGVTVHLVGRCSLTHQIHAESAWK